MRTMKLLMIVSALCVPLVQAGSGTVLVAWAPPADAQRPLYHVYGVLDGSETPLGTTEATVFVAPAGYASYVVRYLAVDGEREVGGTCVNIDHETPSASVDPNC